MSSRYSVAEAEDVTQMKDAAEGEVESNRDSQLPFTGQPSASVNHVTRNSSSVSLLTWTDRANLAQTHAPLSSQVMNPIIVRNTI